MATEVKIYACNTPEQAEEVRQLLLAQNYGPADIVVNEQAAACIYNASEFDGGKTDTVYGKYIVIGKQ